MRRFAPRVAVFALLLAASCSNENDDSSTSGTTSQCTGQWDTYSAGMTKMGNAGAISFTIVDAQPAPPQEFDNTWTLALKDAEGNPIAGATVIVKPRMPAHGHDSPVQPTVTDLGDGTYSLSHVNLSMPGTWVTAISVMVGDAGTPTDTTSFSFCIVG